LLAPNMPWCLPSTIDGIGQRLVHHQK
jgi:hypothetical protein